MNTIQVMGRATADPDVRMTQSGNLMTRFTIAVDKKLTKQQREEYIRDHKSTADFFRVVSWGAVAEILERYLKKGARIIAAGTLTTNSYEKEGERLYFTEIHAERIQIIDLPDRRTSEAINDTAAVNEVIIVDNTEEIAIEAGEAFDVVRDIESIEGVDKTKKKA